MELCIKKKGQESYGKWNKCPPVLQTVKPKGSKNVADVFSDIFLTGTENVYLHQMGKMLFHF
jgi:hypothetical protein